MKIDGTVFAGELSKSLLLCRWVLLISPDGKVNLEEWKGKACQSFRDVVAPPPLVFESL